MNKTSHCIGSSKSCASNCASTLFCSGWLSQLRRIGSFFIHYTESLLPKRLEELNNHECGLRLIPRLNNFIFAEQLIESTYMARLGHEPGRATCLVVKCPDDELSTQLRRLWRGKFQPQQNVRECALDSQRAKGGVSEQHVRQASTWKTTEHNATWRRKCTPCSGIWSNNGQIVQEGLAVKVFYDMLPKPMVTIVLCGNMLYDQEMIDERMMVLMSINRSVPIDTCMITDIVFQQRL